MALSIYYGHGLVATAYTSFTSSACYLCYRLREGYGLVVSLATVHRWLSRSEPPDRLKASAMTDIGKDCCYV